MSTKNQFASMNEYLIKNDESIFQVASKFMVPLYSIHDCNPGIENNWHNGNKINIIHKNVVFENNYPFQEVLLFKNFEMPCTILLSNQHISINPISYNNVGAKPRHIKYLSLVTMNLIVHPSLNIRDLEDNSENLSSLGLLVILYLDDVFNSNSIQLVTLSGFRCDLLSLQLILEHKIHEYQSGFFIDLKLPRVTCKSNFGYKGIDQSMVSSLQFDVIRLSLPLCHKNKTWEMIFQTQIHGTSLKNLVQKTENQNTLIILIQTVNNEIFGFFLNTKLRHNKSYIGNGETFVFTIYPQLKKYPATLKNDYFVWLTNSALVIGGNHTAIQLQQFLEFGFSSASETFDSPQLTSKPRFDILSIEAWKIY